MLKSSAGAGTHRAGDPQQAERPKGLKRGAGNMDMLKRILVAAIESFPISGQKKQELLASIQKLQKVK